MTVFACVVGVIAWAAFLESRGLMDTIPVERLMLGVAAACLLLPIDRLIRFLFDIEGALLLQTYAVGVALVIATFAIQLSRGKRQLGRPAPGE
jgi:hypothetical protein